MSPMTEFSFANVGSVTEYVSSFAFMVSLFLVTVLTAFFLLVFFVTLTSSGFGDVSESLFSASTPFSPSCFSFSGTITNYRIVIKKIINFFILLFKRVKPVTICKTSVWTESTRRP